MPLWKKKQSKDCAEHVEKKSKKKMWPWLKKARREPQDSGIAVQEQEQELGLSQGAPECCICFERGTTAFECGNAHSVCTGCFPQYLQHSIEQREPLRCPGFLCRMINEEEAQKFIDAETMSRYKRVVFLRDHRDCCECPHCGSVLRSISRAIPNICCPKCSHLFCSIHGDAHPPGVCADFDPEDPNESERNEEWKAANTQRCPDCQASVERDGGCDHMKCRVCHCNFCYICGGVYENGEYFHSKCTVPISGMFAPLDPLADDAPPLAYHGRVDLGQWRPCAECGIPVRATWDECPTCRMQGDPAWAPCPDCGQPRHVDWLDCPDCEIRQEERQLRRHRLQMATRPRIGVAKAMFIVTGAVVVVPIVIAGVVVFVAGRSVYRAGRAGVNIVERSGQEVKELWLKRREQTSGNYRQREVQWQVPEVVDVDRIGLAGLEDDTDTCTKAADPQQPEEMPLYCL